MTQLEQHGTFQWNELWTRDVAAACAFYGPLMEWNFLDRPLEDGTSYLIATKGSDAVAGIFDLNGSDFVDSPEQWISYLCVEDLDSAIATATASGAKVEKEPFPVSGVGMFAIVREPGGALIGWMSPDMDE